MILVWYFLQKLAPIQVVIVPIFKGEEQLAEISVVANIFDKLKSKRNFCKI